MEGEAGEGVVRAACGAGPCLRNAMTAPIAGRKPMVCPATLCLFRKHSSRGKSPTVAMERPGAAIRSVQGPTRAKTSS